MENQDLMQGPAWIRVKETYNNLYSAIKAASIAEKEIEHVNNSNALTNIDELKTVELPEKMGKLIGTLDLFHFFQSLGRYIRSFADAEFVLHNIREQVIAKLADNDMVECLAIQALIECCEAMTAMAIEPSNS